MLGTSAALNSSLMAGPLFQRWLGESVQKVPKARPVIRRLGVPGPRRPAGEYGPSEDIQTDGGIACSLLALRELAERAESHLARMERAHMPYVPWGNPADIERGWPSAQIASGDTHRAIARAARSRQAKLIPVNRIVSCDYGIGARNLRISGLGHAGKANIG